MTNAERQKRYRDKKRNAPALKSATRVTVEHERNAEMVMAGVTAVTGESCTELGPTDHALLDRRGGLADYHANPDKYVPRLEPEKLNWGPWMNMVELEAAGLKANRVPIPGDWDYVGVAGRCATEAYALSQKALGVTR